MSVDWNKVEHFKAELDIDNLSPGMILSKAVHDSRNVLLLKQGTELTKRNIRMIKSWGVSKVCVEGESENHDTIDVEKEMIVKKTVEEELKEKFARVLTDPVMAEIMRVAGLLIEKRMLNESK